MARETRFGLRRDGALARANAAAAVILALTAAGCGDDPAADPPAPRSSVCAVAEREVPAGTEVTLKGNSWALPPFAPDVGFALQQRGCSVLVAAERFETVNASEGAPVQVEGLVDELEPAELRLLTRQATARPARLRIDQAGDLALDVGAPFVSAFSVTGEDLTLGKS